MVADYVFLRSKEAHEQGSDPTEQQVPSSVLTYQTLGPPPPPKLWPESVGISEVKLVENAIVKH